MESKFTGSLAGLIGLRIINFFLILFTLGLYTSWAICRKHRWVIDNTFIDGTQLKFDGTGGSLFGNYIKWMLLTIITCGIYGLFVPIKLKQWITEHTHAVIRTANY